KRASAESWQPAGLLLLCAKMDDRQLAGPYLGIGREDQPIVPTAVTESFKRGCNRVCRKTQPAKTTGNRNSKEPEPRALEPVLLGEYPVTIATFELMAQLVLGEGDNRLL